MKAKIERATQEDAKWIKKIFDHEKATFWNFNTIWYRSWLKPEKELWLIVRPFAFAHCQKRKDGVFNLQEIAVDPAKRRCGFGRLLVESIPGPVILKTETGNEAANALYRSLGFLLVGTSKGKMSDRVFNVWQRP
jgi:ribosomal protein S18 acetylase RimI-like enzyme